MVEFLLHNSIGAWWAGKQARERGRLARNYATESEARAAVALPERDGLPAITWDYLRFVQDEDGTWRPAAGTFDGWPKAAAEIRFLDPCMGSGHFLVFALPILARLRMEEEGLGAAEAVAAVLRDNLHGLEIDERCTQIAAFNVALTAWRLGGYQPLPPLHLACSGLAPEQRREARLAAISAGGQRHSSSAAWSGSTSSSQGAPMLGSLIDPRAIGGDMLTADFHELQPSWSRRSRGNQDDSRARTGRDRAGLAKAAEILAGRFTLVATNVPYLGRGKQPNCSRRYCEPTLSPRPRLTWPRVSRALL